MLQEFFNCIDADLKEIESHVDRKRSNKDRLVVSTHVWNKKSVLNIICGLHGWDAVALFIDTANLGSGAICIMFQYNKNKATPASTGAKTF